VSQIKRVASLKDQNENKMDSVVGRKFVLRVKKTLWRAVDWTAGSGAVNSVDDGML
jgi:hypothetical protein